MNQGLGHPEPEAKDFEKAAQVETNERPHPTRRVTIQRLQASSIGVIWIMENKMGTIGLQCYQGYIGVIGIISGLYWGCVGILETKMETTMMGYIGLNLQLQAGWIIVAKGARGSMLRLAQKSHPLCPAITLWIKLVGPTCRKVVCSSTAFEEADLASKFGSSIGNLPKAGIFLNYVPPSTLVMVIGTFLERDP